MGLKVSKALDRVKSGDFPNLFSAITETNAREVAEIAKVAGQMPQNSNSLPVCDLVADIRVQEKYQKFLCRSGYTANGAFTLALGIKGLAEFLHNNARTRDGVLLK